MVNLLCNTQDENHLTRTTCSLALKVMMLNAYLEDNPCKPNNVLGQINHKLFKLYVSIFIESLKHSFDYDF